MLLTILAGIPGISDKFWNLTLFLQNTANGLANGAVYALMAMTVAIIYKTTGHLNFAQGEMAMFSTFVVWELNTNRGWNVWLSLLVVVAIAFVAGGVIERGLIQPLEKRSYLAPVILTLGLFFMLNGGAASIWRPDPVSPTPSPFPSKIDDKVDIIDGTPNFFVTYKTIGVWITVAVLVVLLIALLQKTKLGLAYRAVSANQESARLVGIPVTKMLMFGWALSAALGSFAGVLIAQQRGNSFDINFMAPVLLYGFAAAALGGFDSIGGAAVGGLLVGLAEALIPSFFSFIGTELNLVVALVVILIVLVVKPEGLFGSKRVERV
jgi:branched-chain amino acid transport system permease protein